MIENIPIRFFTYAYENGEAVEHSHIDVVEITETQFVALTLERPNAYRISYERHTMHANGCRQVCLTLALDDDDPMAEDLDTIGGNNQ
tara:strand:+ start:33 stop:296 length:264 start_codon:yes stop_codon:yes gene_type:complete